MNDSCEVEKNDVGNKKNSKRNLLKKFAESFGNLKFGKLKNPKIIILIFVLIVIVVLYFNFGSSTSLKSTNTSNVFYYTNSLEYSSAIESKLKKVISNMEGAGDVSVMVTLASSLEIIYAESTNEKNNSSVSGSTTTSSTNSSTETIIVKNNGDNSPLVVKEILPQIRGVVVVCEGAKDVKTKMKIVQAVKALLEIPSDNIQVMS